MRAGKLLMRERAHGAKHLVSAAISTHQHYVPHLTRHINAVHYCSTSSTLAQQNTAAYSHPSTSQQYLTSPITTFFQHITTSRQHNHSSTSQHYLSTTSLTKSSPPPQNSPSLTPTVWFIDHWICTSVHSYYGLQSSNSQIQCMWLKSPTPRISLEQS